MKKENKKFLKPGSLASCIVDDLMFFWEQYRVKTPRGFGYIDVDANYWLERNENIRAWQVKREIKRLQKREMIEVRQEGDKIQVRLLSDGEILMLRKRIANTTKQLPHGVKCFVTFDVPEPVREVRAMIRGILNSLEGEKVQLSVWSTEFDIVDDLTRLIKLSKMEKWVKVITGRLHE
ncbi:MAG: hypothetical protein ABIG32_03720 [Candidatus Uhrbacteria bacterium]|nr:hypothetical protein [Patescibacteria group bacterium]MBU1907246.1 hypothetical protein [Patescibacteria group bacterium]